MSSLDGLKGKYEALNFDLEVKDETAIDSGCLLAFDYEYPDQPTEVEIDTGSGGISIDFPVTMSSWARDHVEGTIGNGASRVTIDTGSGGVNIRKH